MEVEAVDEGTVAKIVVPAGSEGVKVNALIAILAGEGESVEDAAKGGDAAPAPKQEAPRQEGKSPKPSPSPKAEAPAADPVKPVEGAPLRDTAIQAEQNAGPAPKADGERVFSSPLARRIAKEAGVDVAQISGSGPHGRVVKADVEAAIAAGTGKAEAAAAPQAAATPAAAPKGMSQDAVLKNFAEGSYELVKHDGMRKTIARRLQESKQTIPHFYVTVDCELDALLALRSQLNKAAPVKDDKPTYKLSVNDMVIKALALALRDVPTPMSPGSDDNMVMHKHSDVGVAVSIPGGLITPIIRSRRTQKTLSAISGEMKDLGKRARGAQAQARGIPGRHHLGLQHGHDGGSRTSPPSIKPAARHDPGRRRGPNSAAVVKNGELAIATVDERERCRPTTAPSTARSAPNCWQPSRATSRTRWGCWFDNQNLCEKGLL